MPARSRLGQNFLRDVPAIERIVAALGDCSGETVVEIGPGRGALTRVLAPRAGHLLAVELDPDLAAHLGRELSPERVTVLHQDVLAFDFAAAAPGRPLAVVGNLPYYITSPILHRIASHHRAIDRAVLMMQREVADRVSAAPGSRDYGLLSVTVQLYGPVERLFTLPPEAFSPPPEVHSTVIRWRLRPRLRELGLEEGSFLRFAGRAFQQKRKTIANNLRAGGFPPVLVERALESAGVEPRARAEALDLDTLAALSRELSRPEDGEPVDSGAGGGGTEGA